MPKRFFIIFTAWLYLITLTTSTIAQDITPVVIILDRDSLTLYIPGDTPVSISGLGFEISTETERLAYPLADYVSFDGLRFDYILGGTCLRLIRHGSNPPLAQDCNPTSTLTEELGDGDVFWYDLVAGVPRTLVLIQVSNPVEYCYAGVPRCEVNYIPSSGLGTAPRPTSDNVELPQAENSFLNRNQDWTPQTQSFDGIDMVLVPAGTFRMGSTQQEIQNADDLCKTIDTPASCEGSLANDEAPISTQTFEQPFWIDKTEVTRSMYQECVDAGACTPTPASQFSTQPNHPINRVTWFQAVDYCAFHGGRLPTEAEWEYAARGPDSLIYPWGNSFLGDESNHCDLNCYQSDFSENRPIAHLDHDDGYAIIAPVGSYLNGASWVGALDMAGNVWEWTSTIYDSFLYPYQENDGRNDASNGFGDRILRGGAFDRGLDAARSANRTHLSPNEARDGRGFRCVRDY